MKLCRHKFKNILFIYCLYIVYILFIYCLRAVLSDCNPDAKRLYDEILSNYNKLVRPVKNVTDPVTVKFKLKLSQLIDVVNFLILKIF